LAKKNLAEKTQCCKTGYLET